uniref:Uncharacterized protein n=1 Tax=Arundo donax TaxID=35708 RepID=A0A0A8Y5R3_ARUDO
MGAMLVTTIYSNHGKTEYLQKYH